MATGGAPNMNDLIQCPYDKSHQILRHRFPTHLIKCRKAHKDAKKVTCPFNSTHIINEQELDYHISECESRGAYDTYKYVLDSNKPGTHKDVPDQEPSTSRVKNQEVECSEDWSDICVESYNPDKYCSTAPIIRSKIGGTPSERRAFKQAERARLREKDKDNGKGNNKNGKK